MEKVKVASQSLPLFRAFQLNGEELVVPKDKLVAIPSTF